MSNVLQESTNPTTSVLKNVLRLQSQGTLHLPADYSAENALKAAWFYIQNSENRAKLLACTRESLTTALFDMVVQGMDIGRKQGYIIPYGDRAQFQRSYFGDEALAMRVSPGIKLYYDVIYEGEAFATQKIMTRAGFVTVVVKHEQPFPRKSSNIVGAYCGSVDSETGEQLGITLMDMAQIRKSWSKSKTFNADSKTFHNEQPDQACLRTVIRRHTKAIINSSTDRALLEAVRRQELDAVDAEVEQAALEQANVIPFDESNALDDANTDDLEDDAGDDAGASGGLPF